MAACDEKDPRLPWINERVTVGLKLKSDRFMKMATSEVDGPPLRDFLDTPDIMRIFFVDGAKEMYCYPVPPASTKKKVMYLLKPWGEGNSQALTEKNMGQLVCGDMSPKLMENMFSVYQDVYLPILSNPKNQEVRPPPPAPAPRSGRCGSGVCPVFPLPHLLPPQRRLTVAPAPAGLARGDESRGARALPPHDRPCLRRPRPVSGQDAPAAPA